ncbi:MAG: hypothetical protein WD801_12510 [Gemmatimonadaceae bacterium]
MPKPRSAVPAETNDKSPLENVRDAADALFRAAAECCHQHDRASRVHAKSAMDDEVDAAQRACEACDEVLRDMTDAYETTSANVRPGDDEKWWRHANDMWLASREYLRRNGGSDDESSRLQEHSPGRLGKLHTEFELEASALLALRHAADAYRQDRPNVG